jgi:hypothetical protein
MGRGGKVLECESPPLSAPEPQNDIGSQRDVATPGFLLTGAFHETWLWGRHCLAIANYQWHIGGLLESGGHTSFVRTKLFVGLGFLNAVFERISWVASASA